MISNERFGKPLDPDIMGIEMLDARGRSLWVSPEDRYAMPIDWSNAAGPQAMPARSVRKSIVHRSANACKAAADGTILPPVPHVDPHVLLQTCVSREKPGIEIGPYFSPVAPKRDGYPTTVMDVRDREALRTLATARGIGAEKIAAIEAVDIVGDASRVLESVRSAGITTGYGWIVSSHNLEHLPDPIGFLAGCGALLDPDGALGLILPDKRFCFDRFQPHTTLGGMLRARAALADPLDSSWTAFQHKSLAALLVENDGAQRHAWSTENDRPDEIIVGDCRPGYRGLTQSLSRGTPEPFHGHRWRFTPASFELLMLDLRAVGLVSLEIETICDTVGTVFAVRMKPAPPWSPSREELAALRSALVRRVEDELAVVSGAYRRLQARYDHLLESLPAGEAPPPG